MNSLPKINKFSSNNQSADQQSLISFNESTIYENRSKLTMRSQFPISQYSSLSTKPNTRIRKIHLDTQESDYEDQLQTTISNASRKVPKHYFRIHTQTDTPKIIQDNDFAKEKELIENLKSEAELPFEDQKPKEYIGDVAIQQFYSMYKKLDRIKEQNKFASLQSKFLIYVKSKKDSHFTSMLKSSQKLNILPCKMGIIKYRGQKNSLNIPNHKYGDRYTEMLSEGIRDLQIIQDFDLSKNRIQEQSACQLLPLITRQARVLELNQNKVGLKGCNSVAQNLSAKNCNRIEVLNLEDNQLGDIAIQNLCDACCQNKTLLKINLSRNNVTIQCLESITNMLILSSQLQELYLHWNSIKGGSGATKVFETLKDNTSLRVLDLSYNLLGQGSSPDLILAICEFLKFNKTLCHLDLSVNNFSFQDCVQIAESLKINRTIHGFHFLGNYGYVDTKGFLIVDEKVKNIEEIHVKPRINGLSPVPIPIGERIEKMKNVCWICEGWHELEFKWVPGQSGEADQEPIFIHLDYEGYDGIFLGKIKSDGNFRSHRMVPPGELIYFYTANEQQCSNSLEDSKQERFRSKINIQERKIECIIDEVNCNYFPEPFKIFDDGEKLIQILPRTPDEIYIPERRKKDKRVWTYPISIWAKKYKFETEEILKKCFERDWGHGKVSKFVKKEDEQNSIKEILWLHYRCIKEAYKNYASYNPNGDIFSISQNPMSEFTNGCQLIDGKQLKIADVDLKFIATTSASVIDWKGNQRNPERALVRFQLMEFLVRLAEDKYVRGNTNVNMVQATQMMMEQCKSHLSSFDSHKWRMERYFTEQCDDLCKKYKSVFDYLYNRHSSKKVKPGQLPFMCLDELKEICVKLDLFDENFVDRDVNLSFNLGMMTQVLKKQINQFFDR